MKELLAKLQNNGMTLGAAESCTGGMICETVTSMPGASAVFLGGVVSYANEVKINVLGVSPETLSALGAVCEDVAGQMAEGVRRATGADIGISTTGIAGPGGGTAEKPVGTVCFGVSSIKVTKTYTRHFGCEKERDEIRRLATDFALSLALNEVE